MEDRIDVHDLPEQEVKLIREFVEFLREKEKGKKKKKERKKQRISFAAWPLGIKGKLTRREIYDYL
jgi:hypothetical protein